ncbi:MAG: type I restriction endonuclease [Proteobacteria bacterium]|nr:type I restriction endonuclease [Pseudomonadota bacterium]
MSTKHHEKKMEEQVVLDMCAPECGWVEGVSSDYNKSLALYTEDLLEYIKMTQPEAYEKYQNRFKDKADDEISKLVAKKIHDKGILHYLRHEIKAHPARLKLCQFKPQLHNETLERNYHANICRVVRQVFYSENNKNSIDLVLFVNGIPVATIELKTDFTQTVDDAIEQYKSDRLPKDQLTRKDEPLLTFKRGALVYFAVSTDEVYMTTKLQGKDTFFLPFNKGNNGGKGNPHRPEGFATQYLWQEMLSKESLLNILAKFMHLQVEEKTTAEGVIKKKEALIFPRYHQLDVVRKLLQAVHAEKVGQKYLIQHSAGSGKSNSIAWLSHQLSSLHSNEGKRYFDTVIVITDRTVLDSQLQQTIKQFEQVDGLVVPIERNSDFQSKSNQLAAALKDGAAIIPVTIQTFPFVLDEIQKTTSLKDKKFAIIADEAHSSQSGKTAQKVKEVLNAEMLDEEMSAEDVLNATLESKGKLTNISFFAFTATPKHKTMELFGRSANPNEPTGKDNPPLPFHVYTMQQAIEEGFILDVLKDYTTYETALKIISKDGEREVETKQAKIKLKHYATLHPYAIAQKIDIILTHFANSIKPLLNYQAKAMVVTSSRKAVVRYKIEFDRFLEKNKGNPLFDNVAAMVAFSGKVNDDYQGDEKEYTELNMNPTLKGRDMRDAFDTDDYQVMLVANKFQTGFDQPKLCAMYVDKKLSGVDAVQTLSRLNRTYTGKDHVFILDFVNKAEDIKEAFEPYYKAAEITDVTDENLVYELYEKLDEYGIFTSPEIEAYSIAFYQNKNLQNLMSAAIKPAADRFKGRYRQAIEAIKRAQLDLDRAKDANDEVAIKNTSSQLKEVSEAKNYLDVFKKSLATFIRMYDFLSQVHDYNDVELEKFSSYARGLLPNLHTTELAPEVDIGDVVLTNYKLTKQATQSIDLKGGKIDAINPGQAKARDQKIEVLSKIIDQFNELFSGEFSDEDAINFVTSVKDKVKKDEKTMAQIHANDKKRAMEGSLPQSVRNAVVQSLDTHTDLCTQALGQKEKMALITSLIADMIYSEKAGNGQSTAK